MPDRDRPHLLAVGPHLANTGLTRVMEAVTAGLASRYRIDRLGIGYDGPVVRRGGVTIHPTNPRGGDVFASYQAKSIIEDETPPLVFLLNDVWMLESARTVLRPLRDRTTFIGYCPLDGRIVDENVLGPAELLDCLVVYTQFARREVEDAFARLRRQRPGFSIPRIEVIPHGVDTATFRPLPGGDHGAKRAAFPDDPHASFIVLNANRPVVRKRIDLTIEAFAQFARGKPSGVRLCLHHAVMDDAERAKIETWARRFDVVDRLILSTVVEAGEPNMPDDRLNLLYNACDVGINTSMGEGWGLVSFEHAATGAAQIVPRHSACAEIWDGSAEMLEPVTRSVPPFAILEMATIDPADAASALERLYADGDHRDRMSRAAFENAVRDEHDWGSIADAWDRLFRSLLADGRDRP